MNDFKKIFPPIDDSRTNFQLNKLYIIDAIDVYNFVYKDFEHYKQLNWRRKFLLDEELFNYILRKAEIEKKFEVKDETLMIK